MVKVLSAGSTRDASRPRSYRYFRAGSRDINEKVKIYPQYNGAGDIEQLDSIFI